MVPDINPRSSHACVQVCPCIYKHVYTYMHTPPHEWKKIVSEPHQVAKINHRSSELLSSVRPSREEFCRGQPLLQDVEGGWGYIRAHHCFLQLWGAGSASQQRDVGAAWKSPFQVLRVAVPFCEVSLLLLI